MAGVCSALAAARLGTRVILYRDATGRAVVQGAFCPHLGADLSVGQVVEGYIIYPRLLGDRVELHAVWVIFALFAGGVAFGFLGVLLAVPPADFVLREPLRELLDTATVAGAESTLPSLTTNKKLSLPVTFAAGV